MESLSGRIPITKGVYAPGSIPTSRYMRQIWESFDINLNYPHIFLKHDKSHNIIFI